MLMKQLKMLFQATQTLSSDRGVLNSYKKINKENVVWKKVIMSRKFERIIRN